MKAITILMFLAITMISNAQPILKIGEVFDFELGDEFHIKSNLQNQPPNASRLKVIDKYFSDGNDTVFYKIARDKYSSTYYSEPEPHLEYSFTKDTVLDFYTGLDSSIFTYYSNLHYDSIVKHYDTHFSYDSILEYSTDYCNSLINGFTCGQGDFEPSRYAYGFGEGIGITYEFFEDGTSGGNPSKDKSLFYYKKQSGECGIPDKTTSIEESQLIDNIKIFPNPVQDILNIELTDNEHVIVRLFDSNGKLQIEKLMDNSDNINVSRLTKGMYFLNFQLKYGQINRTIIIQ